jgi:hypothetical protein
LAQECEEAVRRYFGLRGGRVDRLQIEQRLKVREELLSRGLFAALPVL